MSTPGRSDAISPRAVVGVLIVVFGLAQLADNLGWLEFGNLIRFWPFALILVGLAKLLGDDARSSKTAGVVLLAVGALFAAENFVFLRFDVWRWWPLAIIFFGILIVSKALGKPPWGPSSPAGPSGPSGPSGPAGPFGSSGPFGSGPAGLPSPSDPLLSTVRGGTTEQKISEFAVWSGVQRRVTSPAFKRADLTAVMGGIEFDLRHAGTNNGEAVIEVFVLWGGIEIIVPPDWAVSNQVTPIMGGAEDSSTGTQQARHRLVVKGVVIMGGVDIRLQPE